MFSIPDGFFLKPPTSWKEISAQVSLGVTRTKAACSSASKHRKEIVVSKMERHKISLAEVVRGRHFPNASESLADEARTFMFKYAFSRLIW